MQYLPASYTQISIPFMPLLHLYRFTLINFRKKSQNSTTDVSRIFQIIWGGSKMTEIKNVPKGLKYGWYGGTVGGYVFLPVVSYVFFHTQNYWLAVVCMTFFIAGITYSLLVSPWKFPDVSYGKLMIPLTALLIILLLLIVVVRPEYQGQTINPWQLLFLVPLFITPVVITWNTTYNKTIGNH